MTLKQMRKQAGLTLKKASQIVGVSYVSIMRYEKGTRKPSADNMLKLSNIYGVPVESIVRAVCEKAQAQENG